MPAEKRIHLVTKAAQREFGKRNPATALGLDEMRTADFVSAAYVAALPREVQMAYASMTRADHREGKVAKTIEEQTAKLPSDTFLWAAVGSMVASASLHMMGNRETSVFVGQWAPTFLILGLYNKLVKQLGSDRTENRAATGL